MITKKTIQEIVDTAKIEDVVQDFVALKRRGANMLGLCPFHNEKTPSFTVSPSKNIYKCFGCGKGGDPVSFIMEHESVSYPEALRYLANKYNIEIEEHQTSQAHKEEQQKLDSLYLLNDFAKDYYHDQLLQTDIGKSVALSYFKNRGFTDETIEKWALGFAPKDKDAFTQHAKRTGYKESQLKDLGLTSRYGSDFFRDRAMFAIRSVSGKVIGFGGRIMSKNVKAPKYVNTPETEIYNKSKVLFGAYHAKRSIRKLDQCILVEGYTDVISLHQAGIENVVASSGTSLTVEQIRMIKRYTPNIKILYDGDTAGVKAALRGLDMVLEQDMNVKIVLLPEGEDPDSYLQAVGVKAFAQYISSQEKDFILLKSEMLLDETKGDPVKQAGMIKDIVSSIAKIPDPLKRSLYIKECAHLLKVDEQILMNETNKLVGYNIKKASEKRPAPKPRPTDKTRSPSSSGSDFPTQDLYAGIETETHSGMDFPADSSEPAPPFSKPKPVGNASYQERDIVRILITFGEQVFDKENNITVARFVLGNIEDVIDEFDNELYQQVVHESLQLTLDGLPVSQKHFIHHEDEDIRRLAIDVLQPPYEYSPNWEMMYDSPLRSQKPPEENFNNDSISAIFWFKIRKLDKLLQKNQQDLLAAQEEKDDAAIMKCLKIHQKLTAIRKEMAELLKAVVLK